MVFIRHQTSNFFFCKKNTISANFCLQKVQPPLVAFRTHCSKIQFEIIDEEEAKFASLLLPNVFDNFTPAASTWSVSVPLVTLPQIFAIYRIIWCYFEHSSKALFTSSGTLNNLLVKLSKCIQSPKTKFLPFYGAPSTKISRSRQFRIVHI